MLLDEKNRKILAILKKNSRTTNIEIAKKVKMTEGAVRNRISRLLKEGAITRFTIETSTADRFGILMAKAKGDTKRMMKDISRLGTAKDSYEISGEYDGCIIIEGESIEEIDKKIDGIRKLKSVAETRTFISFRRW